MHEGFTRVPITYLEFLSLFQGDEALIFRQRTKFTSALHLRRFLLSLRTRRRAKLALVCLVQEWSRNVTGRAEVQVEKHYRLCCSDFSRLS